MKYTADFAAVKLNDKGIENKFRKLLTDKSAGDEMVFSDLSEFVADILSNNEYVLAFEYLKPVSMMFEERKKLSKAEGSFNTLCLLQLGETSDQLGMYNLSMDYYFRALKLARNYDMKETEAEIYNNIGVWYSRVRDFSNAKKYYQKSKKINEALDLRIGLFYNYNNQAEVALQEGEAAEALAMALKALNYVDEKEDAADFYYLYSYIAHIYMMMNKPDLARAYLFSSLENQQKINPVSDYTFLSRMTLADYFTFTGQLDSLEYQLGEARDVASRLGNPKLLIRCYDKETELKYMRGDFKGALDLAARVSHLRDSLAEVSNRTGIDQVQRVYEIEMEEEAMKNPIERLNPVVVFVSMGTLVVILIVLLVWFLHLKKRNDRAVAGRFEAEKELRELKEKALEEQMSNKREIQENLDREHRKLTTFSLEHLRQSQLIGDIQDDLKRLIYEAGQKDKAMKEPLHGVLMKVLKLKTDNNWEEFQYYFEKVNPGFYTELLRRHPELTAKDKRLCAMLSLGLSSKDIASVTFREVRSVESSRNRLRKKLNLQPEDNLAEYLQSISHLLHTSSFS